MSKNNVLPLKDYVQSMKASEEITHVLHVAQIICEGAKKYYIARTENTTVDEEDAKIMKDSIQEFNNLMTGLIS